MTEANDRVADDAAANSRHLSSLIGAYRISGAIGALARLGVPDALAQGEATADELATRIAIHPESLSRLIEATSEAGLFDIDDEGRYHLTAAGELLRSDVPGSMRRYAMVSTEEWRWYSYCHLDHTLRTGEPGFVRAQGCCLWDYLASHPEAAASFGESLARLGGARDQAIVASLDLSRFSCVVDVGGGQAGFLRAALEANPHLHGVLYDLPDVVDKAREALQEAGLSERCEVMAGDFREHVPAGGDAHLLSWILHDWDDGSALTILRRCREAMAEKATLLVAEMIVPEPGEPGAEAIRRIIQQTDLEMLAVVVGRERTAAEFRQLLEEAGFSVVRIVPLPNMPWSVIEAVAD